MTQPETAPRILSVNVGAVRTVTWRGRPVKTAIWKQPVDGAVSLAGVNLAGDDQADRRVHGGPDKAVYAYAAEDYAWWAAKVGPLGPGTFGDNITTRGIDLNASAIGDRWTIGAVVLEVAQPREPCFKLGIRMGDDTFPFAFGQAGRAGAYLRIIVPGAIQAGDIIEVQPAEQPAIQLGSLAPNEIDEDILRRAIDDPRVPASWRKAAARALGRG